MKRLYAGATMSCISPTPDMLAGINANGRSSFDGIGNDLMLRVVVLTDEHRTQKFLILASDISTFPMSRTLEDLIQKRFGIDRRSIVCGGTRSHNTVHIPTDTTYQEMKAGFSEYAKFFDHEVLRLIAEALQKAVPAKIGGATGVSGISVSREYPSPIGTIESQNHSVPPAHRLRVVEIRDDDGNTIAVIVNYSMHCCLLCWNDFIGDYKMIDGDVGSAVSRYVERAGKHKFPVLWTVGGGTDRQPTIYSRLERCEVDDEGIFYQKREVLPAKGTLMLLRQYAAEQGQDVLRTLRTIDHWSGDFDLYSGAIERSVPQREDMMWQVKAQMKGDYGKDVFYQPGMDVTPRLTGGDVNLRMSLAVIGDVAFAGVNASPYAKNYEALADLLPFGVTALFDDSFGSVSSIPTPDCEEEGIWAHSTLQNRCITARVGTEVFLGAFSALYEDYKNHLKTTEAEQ